MNEEAKFRDVRCLKTNKTLRLPVGQIQQCFDENIRINTPNSLKLGEQVLVTFKFPELQLDDVELKFEIGSSEGVRILQGPAPLKSCYRKGEVLELTCLIQKIAPLSQTLWIYVVFYHQGKVIGYGSDQRVLNSHEVEAIEPSIRDEAWRKRKGDAEKERKARELPRQPSIRN